MKNYKKHLKDIIIVITICDDDILYCAYTGFNKYYFISDLDCTKAMYNVFNKLRTSHKVYLQFCGTIKISDYDYDSLSVFSNSEVDIVLSTKYDLYKREYLREIEKFTNLSKQTDKIILDKEVYLLISKQIEERHKKMLQIGII